MIILTLFTLIMLYIELGGDDLWNRPKQKSFLLGMSMRSSLLTNYPKPIRPMQALSSVYVLCVILTSTEPALTGQFRKTDL